MPKTKISEFSATPGNNTDIDGINIAEGCAPSGINDAIRELMSQLKDFQAGTAGDSFNGPVGTTTAAAGAFTNLSASGTFALTGDQVQISEGGTGQTTANAAFNALAPSQTSNAGKYLKTDGTNTSWDALDISTADITGTLPVANGGTGVTSSTGTGSVVLSASPTFTGTVNGASLTLSSNFTLSGGTANGVAYLNGSKVLTTGSALTFDGASQVTLNGSTTNSALSVKSTVSETSLQNISNDGYLNMTGTGGMIFRLGSGYAEQMRLTSTGLGIGTSSPATQLVVSNAGAQGVEITGSNGAIQVYNRSTAAYGTMNLYANTIYFRTGTSPAINMALDATGNLGIGTSSPGEKLQVAGAIRATGAVAANTTGGILAYQGSSTVMLGSWGADASTYGAIQFYQANSTGTLGRTAMLLDTSGNLGLGTTTPTNSGGYSTLSLNGSTGGQLVFQTGGTYRQAIYSSSTDLNFYNQAAGNLTFSTNATERARITSDGEFLVGTTNANLQAGGVRLKNSGGNLGEIALANNSGVADYVARFLWGSSPTLVGNITVSSTATAYNTSSDRRLKDNIAPADDASAIVDAIQVVKHDWKTGGHTRFGVVAQDLHAVVPEAVSAGDDGEEIERTWSVDYSKLVPMLIKEIQSLRARVAALETK